MSPSKKISKVALMLKQFKLTPIPWRTSPTATSTPPPAHWAATTLNFTPDPHQSQVLDSTHRRVLVNCCRQWGKSTTAAIRALHHALFTPQAEIILIAPTQRQSSELLRKIRSFSTQTDFKSDGTNRFSLLFPNGSRIVALPGNRDSIRGFSRVSLLIIDEAGWVPDALYFTIRPFLAAAPDASLLILSTPNGDSGFFYHSWTGPQPWLRISVPATECSRISPTFLEEERQALTNRYFRQEYLCEFQSHNNAVFPRERINHFFSHNTFGATKPFEFEL
jgi:hypothetical protein